MQNQLVMTVIGKDRTGLVESLAGFIADNHGNWLESRMCRLGGEFAGILRVQVPKENETGLIRALQSLHSSGLTVVVHPDEPVAAVGPIKNASLSVIGHDRPGIIYQISAMLAKQNINVEELETECYSAPMSGDRTFKATARLQIPGSCAVADLCKEMESIGSELMVDISFKEMQ